MGKTGWPNHPLQPHRARAASACRYLLAWTAVTLGAPLFSRGGRCVAPGDVAATSDLLPVRPKPMNDVTRILSAIEHGDPQASEDLLPLVYRELRRLAKQRLDQEKPGQTLQATALVHEAYLRLVDGEEARRWNSRGHFFAAAAEAMRRILVDHARRKRTEKHGGQFERQGLDDIEIIAPAPSEDLLALNDALTKLEAEEPVKAQLVKLRYFAGLAEEEAANALGISRTSAQRYWRYAKAWLVAELRNAGSLEEGS